MTFLFRWIYIKILNFKKPAFIEACFIHVSRLILYNVSNLLRDLLFFKAKIMSLKVLLIPTFSLSFFSFFFFHFYTFTGSKNVVNVGTNLKPVDEIDMTPGRFSWILHARCENSAEHPPSRKYAWFCRASN